MDTVYNDETNGPFLQTFKFVRAGILLALYRNEKTSASMKEGIDILESILGTELFRKYVHVLLTDRGTEFLPPKHGGISRWHKTDKGVLLRSHAVRTKRHVGE